MKAVILAGGFGTRLSEETQLKPKPMVEIGGKPILWHILKTYGHHGIHDFVICLGYKGYIIKEYFSNYLLHSSDVTLDLANNRMSIHQNSAEPWRITLIDTGAETMTGGRVQRIAPYLDNETFLLTYGDGVGDIDIGASLRFHRQHGRAATVTAVQPAGRFGRLGIGASGAVEQFDEKPQGDGNWINGGYFVLEPSIFDYIDDDRTVWEQAPLERLARDGELQAFKHHGFWLPMDTLRDKQHLETLWASGNAPWHVWSDSPSSTGAPPSPRPMTTQAA